MVVNGRSHLDLWALLTSRPTSHEAEDAVTERGVGVRVAQVLGILGWAAGAALVILILIGLARYLFRL